MKHEEMQRGPAPLDERLEESLDRLAVQFFRETDAESAFVSRVMQRIERRAGGTTISKRAPALGSPHRDWRRGVSCSGLGFVADGGRSTLSAGKRYEQPATPGGDRVDRPAC